MKSRLSRKWQLTTIVALCLLASCAPEPQKSEAKSFDVANVTNPAAAVARLLADPKNASAADDLASVQELWEGLASVSPISEQEKETLLKLASSSVKAAVNEKDQERIKPAEAAMQVAIYSAMLFDGMGANRRGPNGQQIISAVKGLGKAFTEVVQKRSSNTHFDSYFKKLYASMLKSPGGTNHFEAAIGAFSANSKDGAKQAFPLRDTILKKVAEAVAVQGNQEALHKMLAHLLAAHFMLLDRVMEGLEALGIHPAESGQTLSGFVGAAVAMGGTFAPEQINTTLFGHRYDNAKLSSTTFQTLAGFNYRWIRPLSVYNLRPLPQNVASSSVEGLKLARVKACGPKVTNGEKIQDFGEKLLSPYSEMILSQRGYQTIFDDAKTISKMCTYLFGSNSAGISCKNLCAKSGAEQPKPADPESEEASE